MKEGYMKLSMPFNCTHSIAWNDATSTKPLLVQGHAKRVIAYTRDHDFDRAQFHDIDVLSFYTDEHSDAEVAQVCTHWIDRDLVIPASMRPGSTSQRTHTPVQNRTQASFDWVAAHQVSPALSESDGERILIYTPTHSATDAQIHDVEATHLYSYLAGEEVHGDLNFAHFTHWLSVPQLLICMHAYGIK